MYFSPDKANFLPQTLHSNTGKTTSAPFVLKYFIPTDVVFRFSRQHRGSLVFLTASR